MTRHLAAALALACVLLVHPAEARQCVRFMPSGAYAVVETTGPCKPNASRREEVALAERRGFRVSPRRIHSDHRPLRAVVRETRE